jgi:transcriptional regulator with XRE-family HTH domain
MLMLVQEGITMRQDKLLKMYSLRDVRLMLRLTQEELAKLAGLAPMYISLIENNKRAFTKQTAEKIANVAGILLSTENDKVTISSDELRASHIASFYPEHIQSYVGNLIYFTAKSAEGLDRFYEQGELPIAEEELYIKMEIVTHLASMLPQSEEASIKLNNLKMIANKNDELIAVNKEKYLNRTTRSDGTEGIRFQLEAERSLKPNKRT